MFSTQPTPNPNQRIKLTDFDLAAPKEEAPELPQGYDAIRVVVRLHREPIGYVKLTRDEFSVDFAKYARAALADPIRRHLEADQLPCHTPAEIEQSLHQECPRYHQYSALSTQHSALVSVAVCTRDRADQLRGTLEALLAQTYPNFEVLVIDNAPSDDSTRRLVEEFSTKFATRFEETRNGKSVGRENPALTIIHGLTTDKSVEQGNPVPTEQETTPGKTVGRGDPAPTNPSNSVLSPQSSVLPSSHSALSTQHSALTNSELGTRNSELRYLVEERPGLDWARNRAIVEARGEILAYTDDDARPDPDWLAEVARCFADEQVDAMTGLVVPVELETPAQVTFEDLYGGFGKGFERKLYHKSHPTRRAFPYAAGMFGAGCNMAFRKKIFSTMGGFDEALDVGTLTGGGGDMDIFIRVLREEFTLCYEPRAVVRHLHRRDMATLERQMGGYARAFFAYLGKWAWLDRHRAVDILGYAGRGWLLWIFIKALLSIMGRNGVPKNIALIQFWNAPLGPISYWRARRRAAQIRQKYGPIL
jgi:glycosyltransferase involved in cell wall biosynthesis